MAFRSLPLPAALPAAIIPPLRYCRSLSILISSGSPLCSLVNNLRRAAGVLAGALARSEHPVTSPSAVAVPREGAAASAAFPGPSRLSRDTERRCLAGKQPKGTFVMKGYSVRMAPHLRRDARKECCFELTSGDGDRRSYEVGRCWPGRPSLPCRSGPSSRLHRVTLWSLSPGRPGGALAGARPSSTFPPRPLVTILLVVPCPWQ